MRKKEVMEDALNLAHDIDSWTSGLMKARASRDNDGIRQAHWAMESLMVAAYQELLYLADYIDGLADKEELENAYKNADEVQFENGYKKGEKEAYEKMYQDFAEGERHFASFIADMVHRGWGMSAILSKCEDTINENKA